MKCDSCGLDRFIPNPRMKGTGNLDAQVVILSDYPSYDEMMSGNPFSGKDSAVLMKLTDKYAGRMFFTNLVKCFPPKDIIDPSYGYRAPSTAEVGCCAPAFLRELSFLPKDVTILGLGSTVINFFLPDVTTISDVNGKEFQVSLTVKDEKRTYRFVPTYSHRFVDRNPGKIKDFKAALNLAFGEQEKDDDVKYEILDPISSVGLILEMADMAKSGEITHVYEDTETNSFNMDTGEIIMIQLGHDLDDVSYSIPLMVTNEVHWDDLPYEIPPPINFSVDKFQVGKIKRAMRELHANLKYGVVGHNIKFDLKFLLTHDFVDLKNVRVKADTFTMANVLLGRSLGFSLSLKELCQSIFGLNSSWGTEIETYINRFRLIKDRTFDKVPTAVLGKYGAKDIHYTKKLFLYLLEMAETRGGASELFRILFRLSEIYTRAETRGVKIDNHMYDMMMHETEIYLQRSAEIIFKSPTVQKLIDDKTRKEVEAIRIAKGPNYDINEIKIRDNCFSVGSNANLVELFYDKNYFGQPVTKKTGKGAPSVDKECLEQMSKTGKTDECRNIAAQLLEYKMFAKIKSTYLDSIPTHSKDGFYKPEFNLSGTVTGRLSSGFHIMPSRSDLKRMFCSGFINGFFGAPDFSQLELRVLAARSKDARWIDSFKKGMDKHMATAMDMFHVTDPKDVTKVMRKAAKAINFGVVFGKGAPSLAEDLGVTVAEAEEYLRIFFESAPGVAKFIEDQHQFARDNGFIVTKFGRFIYIPEAQHANKYRMLEGFRRAVNNDIQSTASDLVSSCFENCDTMMKEQEMKSMLMGSVHDSMEPDIWPDELFKMIKILKYSGEDYLHERYKDWLCCPIELDMEFGRSWKGVEFKILELTDSKGVFKTKEMSLRKDLLMLEDHASKTYHTNLEILEEEPITDLPLNMFLKDSRKWSAILTLEL